MNEISVYISGAEQNMGEGANGGRVSERPTSDQSCGGNQHMH